MFFLEKMEVLKGKIEFPNGEVYNIERRGFDPVKIECKKCCKWISLNSWQSHQKSNFHLGLMNTRAATYKILSLPDSQSLKGKEIPGIEMPNKSIDEIIPGYIIDERGMVVPEKK